MSPFLTDEVSLELSPELSPSPSQEILPLYFYKGIVLKIGVQNSLESAFTILLLSKTLKTLILPK